MTTKRKSGKQKAPAKKSKLKDLEHRKGKDVKGGWFNVLPSAVSDVSKNIGDGLRTAARGG
jgi:hypothetical protein